ncbi:MAG: NHL repeat-containing protein [Kiloniellales bacterium]
MPHQLSRLGTVACLAALAWGAEALAVEPSFVAASDTSFSRPHDLVLSPDGRHLFVADVGNDAIKVLHPDTLATLWVIGRGELRGPHDVAFDAKGRLLVADTRNDRIAIYALSGQEGVLVGAYAKELASPEGVAVGPEGTIYVSNARTHDLLAIRNGVVIARVGGRGSGRNQYRRPHDVGVDAQGRVYAVDPGNDRIQVLTPTLEFIAALAGAPYDFDEPKYLAFDGRGWLYVADEDNDQIKIFDAHRKPIAAIGDGKRGKGPNRLNRPEGVEARGDRVWVADTHNHRILLYRLEGVP